MQNLEAEVPLDKSNIKQRSAIATKVDSSCALAILPSPSSPPSSLYLSISHLLDHRANPPPTAVAPKPPCNRRNPLRLRLHQHRNPKSPKSQIQWTSSPLAASSFVSRPPTKTHTSYNVNAARLLRQEICLADGLAGACW